MSWVGGGEQWQAMNQCPVSATVEFEEPMGPLVHVWDILEWGTLVALILLTSSRQLPLPVYGGSHTWCSGFPPGSGSQIIPDRLRGPCGLSKIESGSIACRTDTLLAILST